MSSRWLVTLALAVVTLPVAAEGSPGPLGFRVERATRSVTTSRALAARTGPPRVARLPPSVELDRDAVLVKDRRGVRVRHSLGRPQSVSWIATVGSRVVIGYAARPGGHADSMIAIDHGTGSLAWRRSVDSLAAVELAGNWLAVERAGALDVIDARTGNTVGAAALTGQGIQSVAAVGDSLLHVKTRGDLVAIERRTGSVRWAQLASSLGNAVAAPGGMVIDSWVDRRTHRYGIASYDARDGRRVASIDLGATSGWYERERVELSPDGPGDVLVSALFATG